jgi:hypothetical protein
LPRLLGLASVPVLTRADDTVAVWSPSSGNVVLRQRLVFAGAAGGGWSKSLLRRYVRPLTPEASLAGGRSHGLPQPEPGLRELGAIHLDALAEGDEPGVVGLGLGSVPDPLSRLGGSEESPKARR